MTDEQRSQIIKALWPEGAKSRLGVWAILDCARDPAIYLALIESRLEFRCLYSGRLPRALEVVAPQLVELLPEQPLTRRLLDDGWGRSWGVLLQTDAHDNLRHHLRKLLQVRDEAGRKLLFRWYDPRVLRAYLPTCTPAELQFVFGPVTCWFTEAAAGAGYTAWSLRSGLLQRDQRVLPSELPSELPVAAA
jgi:Domain of unknown function (DUF4123)